MKYGFGMFTPEGNKRVLQIAASSRTYEEAEQKLLELMKDERFREAFDTEVRAALHDWFDSLHGN